MWTISKLNIESTMEQVEQISPAFILNYLQEEGIVNLAAVQEMLEMKKREELLSMHTFNIWQGKNGKWYTYLPDKEKGRIQRERTTKKAIEDVVVSFWKEAAENPTIEEVFNEWNDRRLKLNKIKQSTHSRNQQIFKRHFTGLNSKRIKTLLPEEIEDFLEEEIADKGLSAKAFSNLKSITRGFLKHAKRHKLISYNVEEIFDELDVSEKNFQKNHKEDAEEVFTEEELSKVIDYLTENPNMYNLGFLLMFVTGLRVGELTTLKWKDYNGMSVKVGRSETRYKDAAGKLVYEVSEPKTEAGYRTVVIPRDYIWIMERLRAINPFTEYIFSERGERVHTYCFRNRLKTVCQKTGCIIKSPHKIRKTYGSILLDNNIDNRLIIGQMGHTNILCTENYYHRNRRNEEKKQQIISQIPEFNTKKLPNIDVQ